MTTYFCWACDKPIEWQIPAQVPLSAKHYETGRLIFFCSQEHKELHLFLTEI